MNKTRNTDYCIAFGNNLRKLRTGKGMTMMNLAFEADIEYSQIAKIERGIINTTISTVYLLAKALDIKPDELFKFDFTAKKKK